ncbi:MAG: hypothetical protein ACJ8CR_15085 [Roseiflexaceae bacterium]
MEFLAYLTTPTSEFGGLGWGLLVVESVAALAGLYLGFLRSDAHPVRGAALRRLGLALLVLGALGVLFSVLWLAAVEPFTMPIWLYGVGVAELGLAAYALFYWLARYPAQRAAYEQSARRGPVRRNNIRPAPVLQASDNNGGLADAARPPVASNRRGSRRDRKRRGK